MKVGMVGLGMMGHGIAKNLLKHGYATLLFEHPGNQPIDDLIAGGAATSKDLATLASTVDTIMLCVTGTPEVEQVLLNPGGLLAGMKSGTTVIDCSTAIPSSTQRVARRVAELGGRFLDAPMTRTPKEAEEGRLNVMVGGDPSVFEECKPLFGCYAENVTYAGPVGSGHRLKLIHNYVSLGFSTVLSEAVACAERAGIATDVLVATLAHGGGKGVVLDRFRPYLETKDVTAFRFTLSNTLKDMSYYAEMAKELGAAHSVADSIRLVFERATQDGAGQKTVPELIDFLADQQSK
jgi:3-hydroxyisobutyrate dehydrogenase-like beta-hydroxyacid dehydrogenase